MNPFSKTVPFLSLQEDLVNQSETIQLINNAENSSFRLTNVPEQSDVSVINSLGQSCKIHKNHYGDFTIEEPAGIYYILMTVYNQELKIIPYYNKE